MQYICIPSRVNFFSRNQAQAGKILTTASFVKESDLFLALTRKGKDVDVPGAKFPPDTGNQVYKRLIEAPRAIEVFSKITPGITPGNLLFDDEIGLVERSTHKKFEVRGVYKNDGVSKEKPNHWEGGLQRENLGGMAKHINILCHGIHMMFS